MELSEILRVVDEQPAWVEWSPGSLEPEAAPDQPRGFAILLRMPDVPDIQGLAQAVILESVEQARKDGAELQMKPGAVGLRLASYVVQDWRGFTGQGLRYFAQDVHTLEIFAPTEMEIPFNRQVLEILLTKSPRFFNFVDRAWREKERQSLTAREDAEKNSLNAPDSTLIPSGAPGALPTKSSSRRRSSVTNAAGPSGAPPTS